MTAHSMIVPARRRTLAALAAAAAALALAGCASLVGPRTITLSDTELQTLLARRFPLSQRVAGLAEVSVATPRVWLIPERNRLGTEFQVSASDRLSGRALDGRLALDYALRFEPSDQTIRLTQVRVQDFQLQGGSEPLPGMLQRVGGLLAEQALQEMAIYRVNPDKAERLHQAGYHASAVTVTSRGVEITLAPD